MPATSRDDYGPLDESIHLADGSHRSDPPASMDGDAATWRARRQAHIDEHVIEAQAANAGIKDDPLLRTLADQVSRVTEGRIFLLERGRIAGEVHYVFAHVEGRLDRTDAIHEMNRIIQSDMARGL